VWQWKYDKGWYSVWELWEESKTLDVGLSVNACSMNVGIERC